MKSTYETIETRVPAELRAEIEAAAGERKLTVSKWLNEAAQEKLAREERE